MKKIIKLSALLGGLFSTSVTFAAQDRIVVLGPGTAELVVALGKESQLVGVGRTSYYPKNLQKDYPVVGYVHRAPAEGLLSVNPTHVIGTGSMGPQKTIDALKESSVKLYQTKVPANTADVVVNIRTMGDFLGESSKAEQLATQVEQDFETVQDAAQGLPKVSYALVWYYRGKVGTRGTGDAVTTINWAGANNVYSDVGRTDVTRESLLARNPEVIFFYASSLRRLKDEEKTFQDLPGIKETDAFKNDKIYVLPGFVSSMGPRTPHAVNFMIGKLHGEIYQANLPERWYAPAESLTEE